MPDTPKEPLLSPRADREGDRWGFSPVFIPYLNGLAFETFLSSRHSGRARRKRAIQFVLIKRAIAIGNCQACCVAGRPGTGACSAETGTYCTARGKLSEEGCHQLLTSTARSIDDRLMKPGFGMATASELSMARRQRCPTRLPTMCCWETGCSAAGSISSCFSSAASNRFCANTRCATPTSAPTRNINLKPVRIINRLQTYFIVAIRV